MIHIGRREFLKTSATAGTLLGLGRLVPPVSAEQARLDPGLVRLDSDIEPLVRLIEDTGRDRLIEEIGARVRKGLSYREVLAALFLATVRNVQPRPVGFKFHSVLVVNAAHQTALASPDSDRWLPIFWTIDHFKGPQAEEKQKTGWRMGPIEESKVPAAGKARKAFSEAIEAWDLPATEAAAAGLARHATMGEAFELFARYGIRDFRDIGHKAIYVAGAFRVLQVIGWQHAEAILRSLANALNYFTGESPAKSDQAADRPGRKNLEQLGKLRADWREGKLDDKASREFLAALRTMGDEEASAKTIELVNAGVSAQSVWDACFASSGEMNLRRADIRSLHALTTLNALRYIYETTASDETRRLALLQAAAFVPLFRGKLDKEVKLEELQPEGGSLEETVASLSGDKAAAARKVLGYLKDKDAKAYVDAARVLIFLKGTNAHDYKYGAAVLEDAALVSPAWRPRYMAASVAHLRGSQSPDSGIVNRIRAALKA